MSNKISRIMSGPPFDLFELEKLAAMNASTLEIARWFKVSDDTIERAMKKPEIAAVVARGRALGRISLRRKQMQLAEEGNATMLIWLGKQLLGQRDNFDIQHTGPDGGPVQIAVLYKNANGAATDADEE